MAKFQISNSIEINRPAESVFQYIADVLKAPEYRPNVVVRDFTGAPLTVGSSWRDVTKFMGRDMVVEVEVIGIETGRQIRMTMDGGVVTGTNTWELSPGSEDSTTVTLSFDGDVTGWMGGLAAGLMRRQAEKNMKEDFARLKSNLESG